MCNTYVHGEKKMLNFKIAMLIIQFWDLIT